MYAALVEISDNFSGIQKHTRLENCVDPIPYLQSVQNQAPQFKTPTGTALTYDQYYELLLSDETIHEHKFKWDTKFGSKNWSSVYDLEQFPNDGYQESF